MRTNITTKNTTTYTLTEADFKRALEAIGVTFSSDTGLAFKQKIDYTKELELEYAGLPAKPSSPRDPKALVPGCVVEVDYGRG